MNKRGFASEGITFGINFQIIIKLLTNSVPEPVLYSAMRLDHVLNLVFARH